MVGKNNMSNNLNLIEGKIRSTLVKLSLPIMGTSFIHMAYNLTDIMWLGRLSTKSVAAAGVAGFFMWFGSAITLIAQIGVGVNVAQCNGREDYVSARKYISNGLQLDLFLALTYSMLLFIFRHNIIGFFNLKDEVVINMAIEYLSIVSIGMTFQFLNPVYSTILNSSGNSVTPFKINTMGLIANIIIDPLLIFGLGPLPNLGIKGAAIATIFSQFIVFLIFFVSGKINSFIYADVKLNEKPDKKIMKNIMVIGVPPFLQSGLHSVISMMIAKVIGSFGPVAVAVQSIGAQIESITWMSAEGFSMAISAFIGHNFGARKLDRIKEGYHEGIQILGGIGILCTLILIFGAKYIFSIFVPDDPVAIKEGINYLRILGLSQFFMSVEIGTAGGFNGLGRTMPPTVIGVVFNILRIPAAIILSSTALGLSGVWWSISTSSIFKGIILYIWFKIVLKKLKI